MTTKHLSEHVRVVRHRVRLLAVVFVAAFAALAARVLFATPVYASHALLQIDDEGRGGLLGELAALQGESKAEAEVEIMRSHRVARGAFEKLRPADFLIEEHAYRPIDMLWRAFAGKREPCTVTLETEPLPEGRPYESYVFDFDAGGLHVEKREEGATLRETVDSFRSGVPFRVHGRTFTLKVDGDPSGRRWALTLRAPTDGARWIREHVRARERGRMTGVVELGFLASSPELARKAAAALAESYIELKREHRRAQARTALDFLRSETERVRGQLEEAERALDRYRAESDAVLVSERAQWLVEKASALELERAEQQVRLEEWRRLRGAETDARGILAMIPGREADPMTQALAQQLARLELERDALEQRGFKPAHPDRRRIEAELRLARARLRETLDARIDRTVAATEARIAHLDETLRAYDEEARALPETERRLTELSRDVRASAKIHEFLAEKEQEAQIALVSTLGAARLVDPPLTPIERTSPKLFLQGLVALVLAALLALGAVFLAEYIDRTIKTPRELEQKSGLTVFAAVPRFAARRRADALVVRDRPHSGAAEAYRTLRTNLRFATLEAPLRTVAVMSPTPGEGKTVTNANLAAAAAALGERVLLLDADLRRPASHELFGGRPDPGLADVLDGKLAWREALRDSGVEGLDVLCAGHRTANPAAILDAPRFRDLLAEAREHYDLVVVDVPPILAVADAAAFLHALDGVLLLARARVCTAEVFCDARDRLRRVQAPLLGAVFNAFDAARQEGYYGRYYGESDERTPRGRFRLAGR